MAIEKTRGQKVTEDIAALLKSRHTLLWVVSDERTRVGDALFEAAAAVKMPTVFWDCAAGFTSIDRKPIDANMTNAEAALRDIAAKTERRVYVMRNLGRWLGDPVVAQLLCNLAVDLQTSPAVEARTIIVLGPSREVPPELKGHVTMIEFPLPDRAEIAKALEGVIASVRPLEIEKDRDNVLALVRERIAPNGTFDAAVDGATGLTWQQAENCYAKSLATEKRIDPKSVAAAKKSVIANIPGVTLYDPDPRGLDAVGGLKGLKAWLTTRRKAFSPAARKYGLPTPKGIILVGPAGTGKSLTAKCVASAWGLPLLRMDAGAAKSKYVGESEERIRKVYQLAETVSPCVLWIDEIEKMFAGATGPQGDGGVSSDGLGVFLSWMQERQGNVFVVATSNDVRGLPPEMLRKGRFDELFWIDLPTTTERVEVLKASLGQYGKTVSDPGELASVAAVTAGFTGAEIAALVPDAMFAAFSDGERELSCTDLRFAAKSVVPLSKTAKEKIDSLREWASSRTRPASEPEAVETAGRGRAIEME